MSLSGTHISIVLFRPRWEEVRETIASLKAIEAEFDRVHMLVSGASGDRRALDQLLTEFDIVEKTSVLHRWDNLGFATGHNVLLRAAFDTGASRCLVLNPDVVIAPRALTNFVLAARPHEGQSLVGPSLSSGSAGRLVVDSLGVAWAGSARHYDIGQGEPWNIVEGRFTRRDGVTGAAMLVSRAVHEKLRAETGCFFDDFFLAYREDAELGIRAKAIGLQSVVIETDGFHHPRHVQGFKRGNALPDLLGVRNRYFLRWKLGKLRPGAPMLPTLRDIVVLCSVLLVERRSLPGLREALRLRRTVRRRGRVLWGSGSARSAFGPSPARPREYAGKLAGQ